MMIKTKLWYAKPTASKQLVCRISLSWVDLWRWISWGSYSAIAEIISSFRMHHFNWKYWHCTFLRLPAEEECNGNRCNAPKLSDDSDWSMGRQRVIASAFLGKAKKECVETNIPAVAYQWTWWSPSYRQFYRPFSCPPWHEYSAYDGKQSLCSCSERSYCSSASCANREQQHCVILLIVVSLIYRSHETGSSFENCISHGHLQLIFCWKRFNSQNLNIFWEVH